MKCYRPSALLALALLLAVPAATASSSETFDAIMQPYEDIRLTLVSDSMEGVGERAEAIRNEAEAKLETEAEEVRPLLPKITAYAGDLAAADDLATAREAFYELSKTLVQYRSKLSGDDLPLVLYCPMVKKSWLQLAEKVGNPYEGKSMESCGNVVGQ